jgi:DNA polymerase-3 subunit gamma/tau
MTYQVLARKWRPRNFQEFTGQEHVVRTLHNALTNQRLHHAYLFTGTRGVGKTTIARILAKCLNCETGITPTPCGVCNTCQEIDAGRFVDLIEVDAASRTKVEDTRELLDNVQYAPTKGRKKIYLIDETHMLSGHSFNALLKTLEEPPPHVIFLLATTDPQKLPITVLSRCLQFHLKNMSLEMLKDRLSFVLTQENIPFETAALPPLARAAQGSMRDALSLLDQAIAYGNGQLNTAEVNQMLGSIEQSQVLDLMTALSTQNANAILQIIQGLAEQAADFAQVLEQLLTLLHQIAVIQAVPDAYQEAWDNPQQIIALAEQISPEDIQLYYQIGLIGRRDLPLAPSPKSGFEMILLRMLAFKPDQTATAPNSERTQPYNKEIPAVPKETPKNTAAIVAPATTTAPPLTEERQAVERNVQDWPSLLRQANLKGPTLALASHCAVSQWTDTTLELELHPSQAPLLNNRQEERIGAALSEYLQKPMKVIIRLANHKNLTTPESINQQQRQEKQVAAEKTIHNSSQVQEIIKMFDAKIVADSIKSTDASD